MPEIQLDCPCGCPGSTFITVSVPPGVSADAVRQAWKDDANSGGHKSSCVSCGCSYETHDDGTASISGGSIDLTDKSTPRLDSIGATDSGSTAGGTTVTLTGHSFNTATPTVKFDGVAGTSLSVTDDSNLDVDTPAGKVRLNIIERFTKLAHGTVTDGPFTVGETVTGATSSATGVVKQQTGSYLMVGSLSGVFQDTETIDGGTSTASASLTSAPTVPDFSAAETITGQTSSVTATAQDVTPLLKVDGLSGSYTASEEILGGTSNARALLAATPMNGFVDITIENVNGYRDTGNVLVSGFEYTA